MGFIHRRAALSERLRRRQLAAWVLVPGPNLRYLTGLAVESTERLWFYVERAESDPFVICPEFEAARVTAQWPDIKLYTYRDESGPAAAVARSLAVFGTRTVSIGAEFAVMRLVERAAVERAVPRARWLAIDSDVATLRQVKDADELGAINLAAGAARKAAAAGIAVARAGVSESQIRAACQSELTACGTSSPFGVVVASGPRSAEPHAEASARILEDGDLCWIDLGAVVGGYCADLTRTLLVGEGGGPDLHRALRLVREAQRRAIDAVRPGRTAGEIDAIARGWLGEHGLGAYFTHRTGHGLGLEVHEAPFIVEGNDEPLRPGMVFTVEPGVYFPGVGGVRIEDDVLVTEDGCRVLTEGQ